MPTATKHEKAMLKLIEGLRYRYGAWEVFRDFVECAALSISNAVDLAQRESREARYLQLVGRYRPEDVPAFPQLLGELVEALEATGPSDVLGRLFHGLEIADKWKGQFFTPESVCRMMALMTLGDPEALRQQVDVDGFVTVCEPAVGGGAMVLGLAHEARRLGLNPQECFHITAVDVDPTCVHMAYVQFALCGLPAIVVRGNSLSLDEHEHWYTPWHILHGWTGKLRARRSQREQASLPPTSPVPHVATTHFFAPPEIPDADPVPALVAAASGAAQLTLF